MKLLKLIIADDERVIRETISSQIDWSSLNIEVIGLCKDGIEAYNMILDESPDIVMTDIRMPGLSGLDLIRDISKANQQIQFILLSGYEEFEYARVAMEYGVKYYLLKPCNKQKIIDTIQQAGKDCREKKTLLEAQLRRNDLFRLMQQEIIYHLLIDGIALKEMEDSNIQSLYGEQMNSYGKYQVFEHNECYLNYVYFLEDNVLEPFLECLEINENSKKDPSIFYGIYVNSTLLLFSYEEVQVNYLKNCCEQKSSLLEVKSEKYDNLPHLLEMVLKKIRRYDVIYAIHNFKINVVYNNQNTYRYIQTLFSQLESKDSEKSIKCLNELRTMTREATQPEFLHMLGNSICSKLSEIGVYSMQEAINFFRNINQEKDIETIRVDIIFMITNAENELTQSSHDYGIMIEMVMKYVDEHISECDLTLKKIAEEYLYMNVDYVSRKFHQTTGEKFSTYITKKKVEKAKMILIDENDAKLQYVAERVGCGNNHKYFSQIFKKTEGISPGKWITQVREKDYLFK
ncbi:MAG: response regulator [Lachnospiraceae bacterium]